MPETLRRTPQISWPSLSDLARRLYGERRGLDTLGREVRRLRVRTRKIGRELRVDPAGAVRVLEARGVGTQQAKEIVLRVVDERTREVPILSENTTQRTQPTTSSTRRPDPYRNPALIAAARAYEQQMYGTSVTSLLPAEAPTDLRDTSQLLDAVRGQA